MRHSTRAAVRSRSAAMVAGVSGAACSVDRLDVDLPVGQARQDLLDDQGRQAFPDARERGVKAPVAPALRVPGSSPVLAVVTAYVQAHKVLDVHIAALLDSRGAAATRGVSLTVLDAASLLGLRQRVRPGRARAGALPAGGSGKSGGLWGRSG